MVGVTISGIAEASRTLRELPDAFKNVAADTIEVGLGIIEGEADARVPVDEGDMKRSLGTNIREDRLQGDVGYGDFKARWVEFGTNDTPAQPSLTPASQIGFRWIRKQIRDWARGAVGSLRLRGASRTKRRAPRVAAR